MWRESGCGVLARMGARYFARKRWVVRPAMPAPTIMIFMVEKGREVCLVD
jgi:hypothetical protein